MSTKSTNDDSFEFKSPGLGLEFFHWFGSKEGCEGTQFSMCGDNISLDGVQIDIGDTVEYSNGLFAIKGSLDCALGQPTIETVVPEKELSDVEKEIAQLVTNGTTNKKTCTLINKELLASYRLSYDKQKLKIATLESQAKATAIKLAGETLRADQGWQRWNNANLHNQLLQRQLVAASVKEKPVAEVTAAVAWNLWLDDIRNPPEYAPNDPNAYKIARSMAQACWLIYKHGMPQHVAFDYNLGSPLSDGGEINPTGYDFAQFLVYGHHNGDLVIPKTFTWRILSINPSGSANIDGLLNNFMAATYSRKS